MAAPGLIVSADDYGYSLRYNQGILRAAGAGALDAASAMVLRGACVAAPLLESGIEIGLHVELPEGLVALEAGSEPRRQLALFEHLFKRRPSFIDGHHHCHACEPLAVAVEEIAREIGARVRSGDGEQRARLRACGVQTPERLVGRYLETQPLVPAEIERVLSGERAPDGVTEWMTHPGLADPASGSSFDAGREDDLAVLLRLSRGPVLRRWRDGV